MGIQAPFFIFGSGSVVDRRVSVLGLAGVVAAVVLGVRLLHAIHRSGDLLSVLQMQARVVGAQIAVVNIRNDQLITRVNLHLALGGSFEEGAEKRVVEGAAEE